MRVLTLSDEVVPLVYSLQIKERFADVALVLCCGDLPYYYIDYVISMLDRPCYYVAGNHDQPEWTAGGECVTTPHGCIDMDGQVHFDHGLLLAGIGGSLRYNRERGAQYTEWQMFVKCCLLAAKLLWQKLVYGRQLDIMMTHAPLAGVHDAQDRPHRGVQSFVWLQRIFRPRYWIHGHVHRSYSYGVPIETCWNGTMVYNTAGYRDLTIAVAPISKEQTQE